MFMIKEKDGEERYKFFSHRDCEYFPCHKTSDDSSFNCLFRYCPLYTLGDRCGGHFTYIKGIKDCSKCLVPHGRKAYDYILKRFEDLSEMARKD